MADALLIAARAVHYAGSVQLAGIAGFLVLIGEPAWRGVAEGATPSVAALRRRLLLVAWASFAVVLVSGAVWVAAQAASMSGRALGAALAPDILGIVLAQTQFGHVFLLRLAFAALALVALAGLRARSARRWPAILLLLASAALLAALAWVGHAAAEPGLGGRIHLSADVLHLLASGAWLGGLVPLALFFAAARQAEGRDWAAAARAGTRHFSTMGVASVALLLASGVVNTWFLAGTIPALVGTPYGHLLLAKIALFLGMVAVAAINRQRLTPRLSRAPGGAKQRSAAPSLAQLQRNSLIEAALGLAILGIVGALGTMTPGLHQQPWWPLPFRFNAAAFADPALRGQALLACASIVFGLLLAAAALLLRRLWWSLLVLVIVLVAIVAPSLGILTEPAYPTSFDQSPTGYTARSIVVGKTQFAKTCARCHGPPGHGDGSPEAMRSTDLTAPPLFAHPDGDLFWWISHGVRGTRMPGFAEEIDEQTRWSLIDFIHASADGRRLASVRSGMLAAPARAPDFSADCPNGSTITLGQLRGRVVHLVFAGPDLAARLAELRRPDPKTEAATLVVAPKAPAAEAAPFCTAINPAVIAAYAVTRGSPGAALSGTEFLVGPEGWLRALWQPGAEPGWRDPAALHAAIEAIRRQPVAAAPVEGHHHH